MSSHLDKLVEVLEEIGCDYFRSEVVVVDRKTEDRIREEARAAGKPCPDVSIKDVDVYPWDEVPADIPSHIRHEVMVGGDCCFYFDGSGFFLGTMCGDEQESWETSKLL
jgi:hypothetical protein